MIDENELLADLPRKPVDEDAFDRLPEDVKRAVLEKKRQQQANAAAYLARLRRRRAKACVMGAVGALLLGLFVDCSAPLFLVAVTLVGAGSGFSVAHFRCGHITGMFLYGGACIGLILAFYVTESIHTDPFTFICTWLFYIGVGAVVGFDTEQDRTKTDTF